MKTANSIRIIVTSPDTGVISFLKSNLDDSRFEVIGCRSSDQLQRLASGAHMAVVDRIDMHPEQARHAISILKKYYAELPIIVISKHSTERDAEVVNGGVFYYLAGYSETILLRVIQAATDSILRKNDNRYHNISRTMKE